MKHRTLALVLSLVVALAGCDSSDGAASGQPDTVPAADAAGPAADEDVRAPSGDVAPAETELVASEKARNLAPEVPEADAAALAEGSTAFAFALYGALAGEEGNLLVSPFSVSQALVMTYAGARGETAAEMGAALHVTALGERVHPAVNALDLALASRNTPAREEDQPFTLRVANALWGQTGYGFLPEFLDLLAENYGAGMHLLDYEADPGACRATINDWVADATEQRILDLIPDGAISVATRLVLTNAIYFKAAWNLPFEERATYDADFRLLDGSAVAVPTMHGGGWYATSTGDGYRSVELPYDGELVSMIVVVPDEGRFAEVEAALSPALLTDIDTHTYGAELVLALPKFEYSSSFALKPVLEPLMPSAFDGARADFSGMLGRRELFISAVVHKTFIAVDEEGTEAAAATAVIMNGTTSEPSPVPFPIDRPFLYLIRDVPTGAVLFVGRVVDPR